MIPDSEETLSEAIREARAPVRIEGGGTRGVPLAGDALSVAAIRGITLYEPGALTLVARAGTPVAEIEAALDAEGQRLAFEPADLRALLGTSGAPTIGGVFATNASGPRRIQGGAARDYALGVRFVDGAGTIVKNGGRVMKNVTGYDLVKLMCGAHGTLGVLTEVSLKVLPKPETEATLMLAELSDAAAVRVMSHALGSPYEVSGAAHCAGIIEGGAVTFLRVEGFEASVNYRIAALRDRLGEHAAQMTVADGAASAALWRRIRDVEPMTTGEGDIWRVSCKPSEAAALVARSEAEECVLDWGGGLVWVRTVAGIDLRARLGAFDGHATLVCASRETHARLGTFHPQAPGVARLAAGLRTRFDPRGILNRGLMDTQQIRETA
jgi:glycolate oxidase FAD binding subunit